MNLVWMKITVAINVGRNGLIFAVNLDQENAMIATVTSTYYLKLLLREAECLRIYFIKDSMAVMADSIALIKLNMIASAVIVLNKKLAIIT